MNAQFSEWVASQMHWSWWQSGFVSVLVCIVWKNWVYSLPPFLTQTWSKGHAAFFLQSAFSRPDLYSPIKLWPQTSTWALVRSSCDRDTYCQENIGLRFQILVFWFCDTDWLYDLKQVSRYPGLQASQVVEVAWNARTKCFIGMWSLNEIHKCENALKFSKHYKNTRCYYKKMLFK